MKATSREIGQIFQYQVGPGDDEIHSGERMKKFILQAIKKMKCMKKKNANNTPIPDWQDEKNHPLMKIKLTV